MEMKTKIYHGKDCILQLKEINLQRAFIICDPFLIQSGNVDFVTEVLKEQGASIQIFGEVVPDPTILVVTKAIDEMLVFQPDGVIAFGGGSAIDTAKAVCHISSKMGEKNHIPLIAIPTTSGTGSEVTSFSVITDPKEQAKYPLTDPNMVPDMALLDPQFTLSVPPHVTADTGMDVLTHALEAYASVNANDFTDAHAEKAMKLVFAHLETVVKNGDDFEARMHMHNASCLAGIAFEETSLGICHSMAHALGGHFHIAHGKSNAMLLPHVISYNAGLEESGESKTLERYAEVAASLGIYGATKKSAVLMLIKHIKSLMKKIGIPQYITEAGVEREEYIEAVRSMSVKAMEDRCTRTNPRLPDENGFEMLYMRLIKGGYS